MSLFSFLTARAAASPKKMSTSHKITSRVEVLVLSNGFAIHCTRHYPGSKSDIDILRAVEEEHHRLTSKLGSKTSISDVGNGPTKYPNEWEILADKGYQGAGDL